MSKSYERKSQGDFQEQKKPQQFYQIKYLPKLILIYIYIFSPDITEMTINQSGYLDVWYPTRGFSKNEVLNYSALEWWCKGYVAGKDKLQNKYFPLTAIHTAAFMGPSRERSKRYFSMHRTEISAFCCVFLSQIIPVLTCNRKTCSVSLNLINIFSCVYSCLAFAF